MLMILVRVVEWEKGFTRELIRLILLNKVGISIVSKIKKKDGFNRDNYFDSLDALYSDEACLSQKMNQHLSNSHWLQFLWCPP